MSVPLTLGAEFAIAKTVDYSVATVARQKGSPAEAFFASMAREGLRAGWDRTGAMLPWWYGALSSGATGATDFVAGSVLAGLLRSQFDAVLAQHPKLKDAVGTPSFDDIVAALRGQPIAGLSDAGAAALRTIVDAMLDGDGDAALLKRLVEGVPGVELQSPISRHLQRAITDPTTTPFAGFVQRNLLSKDNADTNAIGGTVAGYALKGAVTGAAFGHADIGAAVTLLDSLSEGLLAQKAMQGDYRALTAVKAQLLLQGIDEAKATPDWKGHLNNRLLGLMNQMGEEVRLFGTDIGHLAAAGDVVLDKGLVQVASSLGAEAAALAVDVVGSHAVPPPSVGAAANARGFAAVTHAASDAIATAAQKTAVEAATAAARPAAREIGGQKGRMVAGSVASVLRAQVQAGRAELQHHADVELRAVLAADFAREREAALALAQRLNERTREELLRLQADYPHLAGLLLGTAQRSSPEGLQRLAESARNVAQHVGHAGAAGAAIALDVGGRTTEAVLGSEIGRTILRLAEQVWLHVQVEVTLAAENAAQIAQQAAFGAVGVVGGTLAGIALAGEKLAQQHQPELAVHRRRVHDAHARVLQTTHAALQVVGESASKGASELGRLLGRLLRALDTAVGRHLPG